MSNELNFDGRVVVVTGAGAGLGRSYALLFAARGASVVVNDLGSGRTGEGSNINVADSVVNEIRRAGGKAVANYDSVTNGTGIIKTAIDTFGRIDIVINNAGILRDRSFVKMSDDDWDIIQEVHVKGAMKTTKAAWEYFRKQRYGRVIVTASNSGQYGNFGQSNYSTAKAALVGFAKTLAIEGRSHNIHTNVIVPTAGSRLTKDIMPPDFFEELKPELIAPVVVWLCHEDCSENGAVIESALGWAAKHRLVRSPGYNFRQNLTTPVTPEIVKNNWDKVIDMNSTMYFESMQEATLELNNILETTKSGRTNEYAIEHKYDHRDIIIYAIGVGATKTDPADFRYLYENHNNFSILPSYFVVYGPMGCVARPILNDVIPGFSSDLTKVLHGEQYLKIHGKLSTEAATKTQYKIQDVLDKGKNATILLEHETFDTKTGEKLASGQMSLVVLGAGGRGGSRKSNYEIPIGKVPARKPDATVTQKTTVDQSIVYRLSGDLNPLHVDPDFAIMSGFKDPILHGLCSLGYSTRHVLNTFADGNVELFDAIKVRFARPVIPGETLCTSMWRVGTRIYFETTVVERNTPAITGAYIDLKNVSSQLPLRPNECFAKKNLKSDGVFANMSECLARKSHFGKQHGGIFVYDIMSDGVTQRRWTVDVNEGKIYEGLPAGVRPDGAISVDDTVVSRVALGQLDPRKLCQRDGVIAGDPELLATLKILTNSCKPRL